jgi:voltage-dependent calcium channel
MAIIAGIVTVSFATPLYRLNYYKLHGSIKFTWFNVAESVLVLILVLKFLVKIIANGFLFTPNPYLKDLWIFVDFLIMSGLVVNVVTTFSVAGGWDRGTRSLTALRALRLITLIDNNRLTVQTLLLQGASRILDAVLLQFFILIPMLFGESTFSRASRILAMIRLLSTKKAVPMNSWTMYLTPQV